MKKCIFAVLAMLIVVMAQAAPAYEQPWKHGKLQVSADGSYFCHADSTPFFWLGDTGWLLPEKLDRAKVGGYLKGAADAGYNVVQVQTINGVPAYNFYGQPSHPQGWDMSDIDRDGVYGYWDHMDFIFDQAQTYGIYIGMVCIWGGLVKNGQMDVEQAKAYGKFLAERYGKRPNVIWIIGGDIRGDVRPEVWEALATTIRDIDSEHLMTFHPFGRTCSAYWWHEAPWLDFDMFQSGHRRYDQVKGDGDDKGAAAHNEDNWRYVADALSRSPRKPVIDGEPSYEDIPHGLHDTSQPRWTAADVRRYAYWSVFAGAAGHTYGHNSVMQMYEPGHGQAYGANKPWYDAMHDDGYQQMRHLKRLMLAVPCQGRVPDQTIVVDNGERYDRAIATRGDGYLMVYNYTNRPMQIDLTKIPGKKKNVWWYDPRTGKAEYAGEYDSKVTAFVYNLPYGPGNDMVLIAADINKKFEF